MKTILVVVVCAHLNPIQSGECVVETFPMPTAEVCAGVRVQMDRLLENKGIVWKTDCHGGG
jgi:hypothetical protein